MSTGVGDIYLDLKLNKQPFTQGMHSLESTANNFARSIGKKIAGGLSVVGLTKFAKDCLYAGSKLNAMNSMASVAFPSMTSAVQAFAKNASSAFGLSEKMALQYTATLGSMARGMGFNEKQALSMSTAIAGLAGDVASYYSMSQDEAFTKLQSIFTGETESLKSLGVIMTQNALDSYAMAHGFGMTTQAMSEQEKVVLRYQFVMDQLKLAQGDFMRTQGAWGNQVKILKMRFQELQAQLGQGLINVLKPAISALNVFMGKLIQVASVFNAFIAKITGAGKKKGGTKNFASSLYDIGNASKGVSGGLGNIGSGIGGVGGKARKASKAVKQLRREIMGFDKMNKLAKKDKSSTSSPSGGGAGGGGAGGIGGVGGFSGDIAGLNSKLFDTSKITAKLGKLWKYLKEPLNNLKDAFAGWLKLAKDQGKWLLDNILKPLGKWFVGAVLPELINIVAEVLRILTTIARGLAPLAKLAWAIVKPFLKLAGKLIVVGLKIIVEVLKRLGKTLKKLGEWTKKLAKTKLGKVIRNFINKTLKKLESALDKVSSPLKTFKKLWDSFKGKTLEIKGKLGEGLENLGETISDLFGGAKEKAVELTLDLKDNFSDAWSKIKGSWDAVKSKTAELKAKLTTAIKTGAKDKITLLRKSWNAIKTKTAELTAKLKGVASKTLTKFKDKWNAIKTRSAKLKASVTKGIASTIEKLKKAWNAIKSKAVSLKVSISGAVKGAWNTMAGKVNGWIKKLNKLPGVNISWRIPKLAQGGYVSRNTPQLAVIGDNKHEGEVVSPESKLRAMAEEVASKSNGNNAQVVSLLTQLLNAVQSMDTNVYLDGKAISKNTVKNINQQTRTTGRSPILV